MPGWSSRLGPPYSSMEVSWLKLIEADMVMLKTNKHSLPRPDRLLSVLRVSRVRAYAGWSGI